MSSPNLTPITKRVIGSTITIVRPNNVTAYAAGQVWGDGTDARVNIPIPAAPSDIVIPGFNGLVLLAVVSRPRTDTIGTAERVALFLAQPTTILGDQAVFSVSDAEIATILAGESNISSALSSTSTGSQLNASAGVAGRRFLGSATVSFPSGFFLTPGGTLYAYFRVVTAYTPVALETLWITPVFSYQARPTI
jgi:hypothetical protein